jgi:hypothetical protein
VTFQNHSKGSLLNGRAKVCKGVKKKLKSLKAVALKFCKQPFASALRPPTDILEGAFFLGHHSGMTNRRGFFPKKIWP